MCEQLSLCHIGGVIGLPFQWPWWGEVRDRSSFACDGMNLLTMRAFMTRLGERSSDWNLSLLLGRPCGRFCARSCRPLKLRCLAAPRQPVDAEFLWSKSITSPQTRTMLSRPVKIPSSWFPGTQGLLWVTCMPGGSGRVLPKSIQKTPAFPYASATSNTLEPMHSWSFTKAEFSKAECMSWSMSRRRSAKSTAFTPFGSRPSSVAATFAKVQNSSHTSLRWRSLASSSSSSPFSARRYPAMPSIRKPRLLTVEPVSRSVIQRSFVMPFSLRSSSVTWDGKSLSIRW
mmetsp:Transcript_89529/g.267047  ORF Transcript_89529/g.267047 Transcript_89529/m.267047 type:complete len:286 (-) Transcript_89529:548-1405(-)